MPLLIGLIGKKGVGKSTASMHIKKTYGAKIYSLSTPIKKIAEIFGFSVNSIYGNQEAKEQITYNGVSGREFLQKIGTEFGREIFPKLFPNFKLDDHKNIWIQLLHNEYMHEKSYALWVNLPFIYVVDDIRFQDEANYIKKNKGFLLKITKDTDNTSNDKHKSETEQDTIIPDYSIPNNGTIDEFKDKIDKIINLLRNNQIL